MKILITGNLGYVGPVLAGHLRAQMPGCMIAGYDTGYFAHVLADQPCLPEIVLNEQRFGDIRNIGPEAFVGVDAVVHLAAISNDPMGNRYEAVTDEINHRASVRVAELARAAGAKAYVFASSCSMYGAAEGAARKEGDALNPLTAYARSKVAVEHALKQMDPGGMTVTCLRFATACGFSPRVRLDLVLNDFVACALSAKKITVLSDGSPWRPLIDVEDMARAIQWAIGRQVSEGGRMLSVNAGRNEGNYQVRDLAQAVAGAVPGTQVEINTAAPPDKRSYKVDFSLFGQLAPKRYLPSVSLDTSIARLLKGMRGMTYEVEDFRNSRFIRLKVIDQHIQCGRLGSDLRWAAGGAAKQVA